MGQYTLKQPTLYSALKRLESQDFVTSYWGGVSNGGARKYFQITDKGKKVVEQNLAEWEYSRTVIDSLISEKDYDFNNPPPSAVDFSLLKKSTTRVKGSGELDHDDIELGFNESEREPEEEETDAFDASDEEQADVQADEQPRIGTQNGNFYRRERDRTPLPHRKRCGALGKQRYIRKRTRTRGRRGKCADTIRCAKPRARRRAKLCGIQR